MLVIPTELRSSPIHGIGVFLLFPVKKGDLVWRFDTRIDRVYSEFEVETFPTHLQQYLKTYTCKHKGVGLYMLCGDNMRFCNHSDTPNLLSSPRGGFGDDVAKLDLDAGTELTVDYRVISDDKDMI